MGRSTVISRGIGMMATNADNPTSACAVLELMGTSRDVVSWRLRPLTWIIFLVGCGRLVTEMDLAPSDVEEVRDWLKEEASPPRLATLDSGIFISMDVSSLISLVIGGGLSPALVCTCGFGFALAVEASLSTDEVFPCSGLPAKEDPGRDGGLPAPVPRGDMNGALRFELA